MTNRIVRYRKHIEDGGRPTPYFFNKLKLGREANLITEMEINGHISNDISEIENHMLKHYENTFQNTNNTKCDTNSLDNFLKKYNITLPEINEDDSATLNKDIPNTLMDSAIKMLKDNASPGPDGISAKLMKPLYKRIPLLFQKAARKELGDDELQDNTISPNVHSRQMIVIPKSNSKRKCIKKLRPLSMLSTSYKFLSNILTIQAKNTTQKAKTFPNSMHAYLKNRSGQEAVRIILDLIQNAQFTQTDLHILSADIDSAFDCASRDFLIKILQKLNFPPNFLRRLTTLFNHNQIALYVNGHTLGLIKHNNGLRQGDPLFALLFNITILPLALALQKTTQNATPTIQHDAKIRNIANPNTNSANFVNYADDNNSCLNSISAIPQTLQTYKDYAALSNLHINISKTKIASTRQLTNQEKDELYQLGFKEDKIGTEITFLGHTYDLLTTIDSTDMQKQVAEIINTKLSNLTNRLKAMHFSLTVKEIVIKTYLNSSYNYLTSPILIERKYLHKAQRTVDSYTRGNRSFTSGKQKYLPLKQAGAGATNIYLHLLANQFYWLRKLVQANSLVTQLPIKILQLANMEPKDLLIAADWELAIISNIFTHYGLTFWSKIIKNISTYRYCTNPTPKINALLEPTTEIADTKVKKRITNYMKKNLNKSYLKLQPTILSPIWLPVIRTNYYKIHLLDFNNQLMTLEQVNTLSETVLPPMYYTQLQSSMECFITMHAGDKDLDSLAPNPCINSLLTNNHHGLSGKIYDSLVTQHSINHFSAHTKWNKTGHLYSKEDITKAANTICNLKISASIKDTLLKHNLKGYIEIKQLAKLGYLNSTRCPTCEENNIDYDHILFDCPSTKFILALLTDHIKQVHKTQIQISIQNIHILKLTPTQQKLKPQIKSDLLHLVAVTKYAIHNNYHKNEHILSKTNETPHIRLYNDILHLTHLLNRKMHKFRYVHRRFNHLDVYNSNSLLSIYSTYYNNNLTRFLQENTLPQKTTDDSGLELLQLFQMHNIPTIPGIAAAIQEETVHTVPARNYLGPYTGPSSDSPPPNNYAVHRTPAV